MMGEFILYYRGKIVGGIYDDRLLVKKTRSALELMPEAICDLPYEGAKEMLLVDEVDSKVFLTKLFEAMYDELPYQNKNKSIIKALPQPFLFCNTLLAGHGAEDMFLVNIFFCDPNIVHRSFLQCRCSFVWAMAIHRTCPQTAS